MDLLIRLIEWLVRSALEQNKRTASPPVSATPGRQGTGQAAQRPGGAGSAHAPSRTSASAQSTPPRSQPLVTSTAAQDPVYDDRGWRLALTLLALAALAILGAIWLTLVVH